MLGTINVGNGPHGVAVTPDGSRVYVTNRDDNTVSVIDAASGAVIGSPIAVGNAPQGLAVSPDGTRVYVCNPDDNTVLVIDTATNAVIGNPIGVSTANWLAFTPDGTRAYVTQIGSADRSVAVIDTDPASAAYNTVIALVLNRGRAVVEVAVNSDGTRAYVTSTDSVSVIDTDPTSATYNRVLNIVAVGTAPQGVAVNSAGQVFVANQGTIWIQSDTVSVLGLVYNLSLIHI